MSRPTLINLYARTESLSERARHRRASKEIEALVRQGLAEWIKGGAAARLTEPIKDSYVAGAAISHEESEANAGLGSASRIARAKDKVSAWPSVCEGRAPLPSCSGAVKAVWRDELRSAVFVGHEGFLPKEDRGKNIRMNLREAALMRILSEDSDIEADEDLSEEDERARGYGLRVADREPSLDELDSM